MIPRNVLCRSTNNTSQIDNFSYASLPHQKETETCTWLDKPRIAKQKSWCRSQHLREDGSKKLLGQA